MVTEECRADPLVRADLFAKRFGKRFRKPGGDIRKLMRHGEFTNRNLDFMPGSSIAPRTSITRDRLHITLWLLQNFDDDDLPGFGGRDAQEVQGCRAQCADPPAPRWLRRARSNHDRELVRAALNDLDNLASGRPRRSAPVIRASTRSPCSTFAISCSDSTRSGPHRRGSKIRSRRDDLHLPRQ